MKTVMVDVKALHQVLQALVGPPHLIAELQAIRALGDLVGDSPIDVLIDNYNDAVAAYHAAGTQS